MILPFPSGPIFLPPIFLPPSLISEETFLRGFQDQHSNIPSFQVPISHLPSPIFNLGSFSFLA